MMHEAITWWRNKHGIVPPIGYELRDHWGERWSRFHCLPLSKRYPETAAEYTELERRARAIAHTLFSPGETVYGFHSTYTFDDAPPVAVPARLTELLSVSRAKFQVEGGEATCFTRAFSFNWPLDRFDALIRQVADEEITMLTFVAPASRNVLCPYDGGFDIFTHALEPGEMRERFAEWLSDRPDFL